MRARAVRHNNFAIRHMRQRDVSLLLVMAKVRRIDRHARRAQSMA
jgi:hypothetical protein